MGTLHDPNAERGTTETLDDALPKEMARVRDEILPVYLALGASGSIAATFIRVDLDRAAKAMISGDIVEMVRVYQSLKEYKL